MITLAIDNFEERTGRPLPNGVSLERYHEGNFDTESPRLDYPRIFYYLKESNIDCVVKHTPEAGAGAWYPMTVGWFDFTLDYFDLINPLALDMDMKIVFFYQEGDNPERINQRLTELADKHGYHNIAFVSGNSVADQYEYTYYWSEVEYMYKRTVDFTKASKTHFKRRSKHFTALCRIDKLWRKAFMSNLWKKGLHEKGYFSYCQDLLGQQDDYFGVPLHNDWLASQQKTMDEFIAAGPFFVDDLSMEQRNDHSIMTNFFYDDSYINIVLESLIDIDSSGGQCFSEKTLKPILNQQPFICVAGHHHLKHLRDLGYETFGGIINEEYDSIEDGQQRFEAVMKLSEDLINLSLEDLHDIYVRSVPILEHNRDKLENGVTHRLHDLVEKINYRP